ncbi:MAG: alpha-mannosidase [Chloroflexota bacterium]|nr:alpha-mannosidase [Chloroflexota bacterium]
MRQDRRFTVRKLTRRIEELGEHLFWDSSPLAVEWQEGRLEGADPEGWRACPPGSRWGRRDICASFRARGEAPEEWDGKPVVALLQLATTGDLSGPEGLVYLNGETYQGLDRGHTEVRLTDSAEPGQRWEIEIEGYTSARLERDYQVEETMLAVPDETAIALYYNAKTALEVAQTLEEEDYNRTRILRTLDEGLQFVDWRGPLGQEFRASLARANAYIESELYGKLSTGNQPSVVGVGHAHIDTAWLWTLAQTREKAARTFATVLRLMERYPEYHFTQSQPQLYQFVKEDHPELLPQIARRVEEGRWEPIGGTWVEMDCNVTGGESLVRQFLLGTRLFEEYFSTPGSPVLWLPDVFGYAWALPQIIKRAGFEYFMTTKISWNEYNKLPYDSFWWRGIDGTEVLTHFINTPSRHWFATYNGTLEPWQVKGTWDTYKQKEHHDEVLLSFGLGDGGGGPTAEMLEYGRRLRDFPGSPRLSLGRADDFFRKLEEDASGLPVWNGELYLEFHRGTYTTQARNKRANRKSELLYHDAELFGALAHLWGDDYPQDVLNKGWELILLNQFHDIIPGSSIGPVYEESQDQYRELMGWGEQVLDEALEHIVDQMELAGDAPALVVFNPTGWVRCDPAEVKVSMDELIQLVGPIFRLIGPSGEEVPYQPVGEWGIIFPAKGVPANGYHTYRLAPGEPRASVEEPVTLEDLTFENRFFSVQLNQAGQIISWWDKIAERQVLPEGKVANQFQAFEDKPLANDAWNINIYYQDKQWNADDPAQIRVLERGPLRACLEVKRAFLHSEITQRITAYADLPRLDFETEVEWWEKHVLLKVAFPVEVHNTRATYDIQFGNVERPTHWNTSWDWARFETCAHKWVDLSEGDYGVSLLNDCKYGHDIKGNVIRLTLLRSPAEPDPHADEGHHEFTYSLLPHAGGWRAQTVQRAYELNEPLLARFSEPHEGTRPDSFSLVSADVPNVVVETVKRAEEGEELIVRCYECYNQRGPVTLTFGRPIVEATECNLMEREDQPVEFEGDQLLFHVKPYQIRTFRVCLK